MAKRTQKAGATGRFGARYGVSVRRNAGMAMKKKNARYTCPTCQYRTVRRKSVGIWHCPKCDYTFAGGAWEPYTRASEANNRILRRGVEGATATDMAVIAQTRALEYEKTLSEREDDSDVTPTVQEVSEEAPVDDEEE